MGSMRIVSSPVEGAQLAPLASDCEVVQFGSPLTPGDYELVAALLETRPDVPLRVLWNVPADLEFLRHFPNLRRFTNHAYEASTLDALLHVPRLTHLDVDAKRQRFDIRPLRHLPVLESVKLEKCKGTSALAELPALRDVTLVGCNLGKRPMTWAHAEKVLLVSNKGALPYLPRVLDLSINATTNPALGPLSNYTTLQELGLHTVRGITELPDLSLLSELRRVVIYRASQLEDVSSLAALPNLRELELREVPLKATDVAFLAQMPRLTKCRLQFTSAEETRAACEALAVASAGEHNPYSPFVWQQRGAECVLLLFDPCVAPEMFERARLLENGHAWGEVASRLIAELGLKPTIEMDCEADMFCARSDDEAALRRLAEGLSALAADPEDIF